MSHFSSNVPIYDKNLILIIFPFCLGKAETKICTVNTCQQTRIFSCLFPPNSVATLRGSCGRCWGPVFIRGGVIRVWQIWWPLQHTSSFIFRFRRKSRRNLLLGRRARFLSYVHFSWQAWHFRTFWSLNRRLPWQVQDIGHVFIRVAGMVLSACC